MDFLVAGDADLVDVFQVEYDPFRLLLAQPPVETSTGRPAAAPSAVPSAPRLRSAASASRETYLHPSRSSSKRAGSSAWANSLSLAEVVTVWSLVILAS